MLKSKILSMNPFQIANPSLNFDRCPSLSKLSFNFIGNSFSCPKPSPNLLNFNNRCHSFNKKLTKHVNLDDRNLSLSQKSIIIKINSSNYIFSHSLSFYWYFDKLMVIQFFTFCQTLKYFFHSILLFC